MFFLQILNNTTDQKPWKIPISRLAARFILDVRTLLRETKSNVPSRNDIKTERDVFWSYLFLWQVYMWTLRLFSVKNSGTDGQILHDFPSSGWKSVKWLRVFPVVAITLAWQIVQATCFSSNFSTSHVARWILKCTRQVWVNTTGFSRRQF